MARLKGQGFNKEKLAFLAAAVLMAVSIFLYVRGGPTPLEVGQPVTDIAKPGAFAFKDTSLKSSVDRYLAGQRKSPFTPDLTWRQMTKRPIKKPVSSAVLPPPSAPPPQPKSPPRQKQKNRRTYAGHDKDLEVAYMGIVRMSGKRYALLKPKDGSSPRRVKEGDNLDPWDYTITKIEKQAIYLTDADGRPYVLKDGRFTGAESSGGGAASPGRVSSFTAPAPKAKPKPKPKPKASKPKKPKKAARPKRPTRRPEGSHH